MKKLFLLLALLLLSINCFASAPISDFNFLLIQDWNKFTFHPTIGLNNLPLYWMDWNFVGQRTFYGIFDDPKNYMLDTFSDYEFDKNFHWVPGLDPTSWTAQDGTFVGMTGQPVLRTYRNSCPPNCTASIFTESHLNTSVDMNWSWRWQFSAGEDGYFYVATNPSLSSGFSLFHQSPGHDYFYYPGGSQDCGVDILFPYAKINRGADGTWSAYSSSNGTSWTKCGSSIVDTTNVDYNQMAIFRADVGEINIDDVNVFPAVDWLKDENFTFSQASNDLVCLLAGNVDGNHSVCKNVINNFDSVSTDQNTLSLLNTRPDGNHSIEFNLNDANTDLRLRIYLSSNSGSFETLLFDYNLMAIVANPTQDLNCGDSALDFSLNRHCHMDWNIVQNNPADGNYFLDLNLSHYAYDGNQTLSTNTLLIDTKGPTVSWDGNYVWQKTDANVHLTCNDGAGSGCSTTQYRIDLDRTSTVSMGAWQTYDQNIFFTGDGNYAIDFNNTDVAGNIGDTNRQYVLIDNNAPYLVNASPNTNTTWTVTTFPFAWSVVDGNGSYAKKCDFNAYVDGLLIPIYENAVGTISADKRTCTANVSYNTAHNQVVTAKARVFDYVDLNSDATTSFSYTFNLYSGGGGSPGGGGGGGSGGPIGPPEIPSVNGQYLKINCVYGSLEVSYFERTKFFCEIKNLKEKDLNIAVDFDNEAAKYLELVQPVSSIPSTQTIQMTFQTKLTDLNNTLNSKFTIRGYDAYGVDKQEFKVTFIPKVIPSNPVEAIWQQLNKDLGYGFKVWHLIVLFVSIVAVIYLYPALVK